MTGDYEAFPTVDPGREPTGHRIIVQMMRVREKTRGGIILADNTRDLEEYDGVVARVVRLGPGAYRDRATGSTWAGGPWCHEGDFVEIPKYGGHAFKQGDVRFRVINDDNVVAKVASLDLI